MPELTEVHRLAQLRLGTRTVVQLRAVWPLLDPDDLDGTFPTWLSAVQPIVESNRFQSTELAAAYFAALRLQHLGDAGSVVRAEALDPNVLATSMLVTGPVSIRSNLTRMTMAAATDIAESRVAGAAMRHTLNAGRETITSSIRADRRALGYQRIASGNACAFCSMLADRGAVYGENSASFEAHDRCGCTAEPVFR